MLHLLIEERCLVEFSLETTQESVGRDIIKDRAGLYIVCVCMDPSLHLELLPQEAFNGYTTASYL